MRSLLNLLPFAAAVAAQTSILLPLYEYPGDGYANWANVTAAIAASPSVKWWVVVNPNSGPGFKSCPDTNYQQGIVKLKSYSNVVTLGYVDTDYSKRAYQNVTGNITTYANWGPNCPTYGDISVDGIFFDDVPNDSYIAKQGRAGNDTYYRNITSFAYDTVPSSYTPIVLNAGPAGPAEFYNYCDIMVEDETAYSGYVSGNDYGQATLTSLKSQNAIFNQSSIILYNISSSFTAAQINATVHVAKTNKVAFLSMTQDDSYQSYNGTFLKAFAKAVQGA